MGLADLKKNASSCKAAFSKQMSIEEFIDNASLYALGQTHEFTQHTNVVDFLQRRDNKQATQSQQLVNQTEQVKKPFRHATFTLSEQAISDLTALSQASKMAKSKLIRHLIAEHNLLSDKDKQALYQQFEHDTQLKSLSK